MKSLLTFAVVTLCGGNLLAQAPEREPRPNPPRTNIREPAPAPAPPAQDFRPPGGAPAPAAPPVTGAGGGGSGFGSRGNMIHSYSDFGPRSFFSEERSGRTLLIGTEKMSAAASETLRKDLNIMARILDKAVERALHSLPPERRMGITVMALPGAGGENLFINDYGAIFVLDVPIPLSPIGKPEDKKDSSEDSDWEQTKRELYENRPYGAFVPARYDAAKVQALKKELLSALKNATNIQELKGNETVTIVVSGSDKFNQPVAARGDKDRSVTVKRVVKHREGAHEEFEEKIEGGKMEMPGPRPSTLTIRAKKSDIDAFAKGKLSQEEFSERASATVY